MDLSMDLKAVRVQASALRNPSQGSPNYKAELALWQKAETRWRSYAEHGMGPATPPPADPMALARQRNQAVEHMQALAARGIHLSTSDAGDIIARPSALLLDFDRQRLRQNKTIIAELLKQEERL